MDKRFIIQQWVLAFGLLLLVTVLFEATDIDMWVQDKLYLPGTGEWMLDKHNQTLRLFFYDGPKKLLTLLAGLALLALIILRNNPGIECHRQGLLIVLVSIVVTLVLVGTLKALTNVPCPKDLNHFGGNYPYVTFLHRIPITEPLGRVRCFPAGHAGGGFALLSLFFLFQRERNRWIGFGLGMTLGWTFGVYKMLIGDHFLSHTLVSMCLAWLVSILVAACVYQCSGNSTFNESAGAG